MVSKKERERKRRLSEMKASSNRPKGDLIKTPAGYEERVSRKFSLRFDYMLEKECHFDSLNNADYKKLISFMNRVCLCSSIEEYNRSASNPARHIDNSNDYAWLFSSLGSEIEMWEVYLTGDARCFFFVDADKALQIRAVRESHLETRKVKR